MYVFENLQKKTKNIKYTYVQRAVYVYVTNHINGVADRDRRQQ
jgi:hypothetical protein